MGNTLKQGQSSNFLGIYNELDQTQMKQIKQLFETPTNFIKVSENKIALNQDKKQQFILEASVDFQTLQTLNGYAAIYKVKYDAKQYKIIEGQVIRGKLNGFGVIYRKQHNFPMYQGTFKDNQYHGWGVTPQYRGQFQFGKRCGWGYFYNQKTHAAYTGFWQDDQMHGMGSYNLQNSKVEDFLKVLFIQAKQRQIYAGQWKFGKKNGYGKLVKKNAKNHKTQIYIGTFSNNLYHGEGVLYIDDKIQNQGIFSQGKFKSKIRQ